MSFHRHSLATRPLLTMSLLTLAISSISIAQSVQRLDEEYTAAIREFTTDDFFSTPYVDHLPASDTVPTPKDVLGHIAGAADVLSYSDEVHKYMRAVAEASPRVSVFSGGTSEEGREMILVAAGSEESMANLDKYKGITKSLSDPRKIDDDLAADLVRDGKVIYWATGAMHSPETGSPEMLMELVYRLAVEETPFIQAIRDNVIFLTTPVLDVDGRDKRVDLQKLRIHESNPPVPRLLYWGKYVAHDSNRDAMTLSLALSQHMIRTYFEYTPTVLHDLHESASHLYVSTGTGPYNPWIDPILVDEWHLMAYQEVNGMTRLGVPGVWTHNFYDGWAANYGMIVATGRNSIGRFYETQGAGDANTRRISARGNREWYRPNPPLSSTMWSIRNNVNMQQSGLLIALNYMAKNKSRFLENFYLKSKRSVEKAHNEGPAAYVFPADDPRLGQSADLLRLLQMQGCEIHRTTDAAKVGEVAIPGSSYIVRMDQPYSRMADMLLDRCYYNANDPRAYDDTGWTLGPLFNARVVRVADTAILDVEMEAVTESIRVAGGIEEAAEAQTAAYLINYNADNHLATFRFAHPQLKIEAAEAPFEVGDRSFNAGTFIIPVEGQLTGLKDALAAAAVDHEFTAVAVDEMPSVATHPVGTPRLALMHNWTSTQNEGWVRIALDQHRIPYDYISVHEARDNINLRGKYDVILMGPSSSNALSIVDGLPMTGEPIPWKASEIAPNIGRQDETDDMRGGLGLEGVVHLRDFVRDGGVLITLQNSCSLPVHFGLAQGVSIAETEDLQASGSVLQAEFTDQSSPIRYGYGDSLGVFFRSEPVLRTGGGGRGRRGRGGGVAGSSADRMLAGTARPTGRGTLDDGDIPQGRPRTLGQPEQQNGDDNTQGADGAAASSAETTRSGARRGRRRAGAGTGGQRAGRRGPGEAIEASEGNAQVTSRPSARRPSGARTVLRFHPEHEQLLISGMLVGGDELAGTPAVIDAPLGDGHVVLFAINPMWRNETQGSYAMVFNSILHFDHLDAWVPPVETADEPEAATETEDD